jgi:hypothetical protein
MAVGDANSGLGAQRLSDLFYQTCIEMTAGPDPS